MEKTETERAIELYTWLVDYYKGQAEQFKNEAEQYRSASESCQNVSTALSNLSNSCDSSLSVLSDGCQPIYVRNKIYDLMDNIKKSILDVADNYNSVKGVASSTSGGFEEWATAYQEMIEKSLKKSEYAQSRAEYYESLLNSMVV